MPKKKLSKKKLAELKRREEEERVRLAEEEKNRIQLLKQRAREMETQRIQLLKEARLAHLERERIAVEEQKFNPIWLPKLKALFEDRYQNLREHKEWQEFIQCSELPNPEDESEINSYLTLWRDQGSSTVTAAKSSAGGSAEDTASQRNIEQDFKDCSIAMQLYQQIEAAMYRAKLSHNEERARIHLTNMIKISQATIDTLDDMTAYVMQFSDLYIDPVDDQFATSTAAPNIVYGLWVNIAKNARKKYVQFEKIDASCELALRGMALQKTAIRIMQLHYDPLTIQSNIRSSMIPVGGIHYMDILHIPPPPSTHKGWTIRKLTSLSKRVKRRPYEQTDAQGKPMDPPPTRVSFIVPKYALIRKEVPSVAWWDEEHQTWSQDGIPLDSIKYNPSSKKISFTTTHLTCALSVVHERVFDVPYRSWFVRPLPEIGKNVAVFGLQTCAHPTEMAYIEDIVILVHNDNCKLLSPLRPELEHITSQFFEPRVLLQRLSECGIHLLLEDEDAVHTERQPKLPDVEQKAYQEISYLSNICSFSSSKWNHDLNVGQDKTVFRVSADLMDPSNSVYCDETLRDLTLEELREKYLNEFDVNAPDSWENVAYWNFKASYIQCKESSDELNLETIPNHETHLNLALCLDEHHNGQDVMKKIEHSDMLVCETIRILMLSTRVLSFG